MEKDTPSLSYRGGNAPGPASFLITLRTSGSRGKPLIAFVCSSGKRGVGTAPVSFSYLLKNSGSLRVFLMAACSISARSLGTPGGATQGVAGITKGTCQTEHLPFFLRSHECLEGGYGVKGGMLETKPFGTLKGGMDVDEVFLDPLGLAPENGFSGVGSAIDLSALKGEVHLRPAIAGDEDRIFQNLVGGDRRGHPLPTERLVPTR